MGFGQGASPAQQASEARIDEEMYRLITQLTNEVNWHMRERGLTRADLAARMGVSPGRVSQILSGGENLTLRTLAALATALDARFDVELSTPKAEGTDTGRDTADAVDAEAKNHRAVPGAQRFGHARVSGASRRR
jgi:transcriptional regulator with XRE-family HTH domain